MTNLLIKYLTLLVFLFVSWTLAAVSLSYLGLDSNAIITLGMVYGFVIGWNWERITDWLAKKWERSEE